MQRTPRSLPTTLRHIALLLMLVALVLPATAQQQRADQFYELFQYDRAIPLYLRALKKEQTPQLLTRLGDCYHYTQQFQQAELFYQRALDAGSTDRELMLHYGEALRARSKTNEARAVYAVFATNNDTLAHKLVQQTDIAKLWKGPGSFTAQPAPIVNTAGSEFCPVPLGDGMAFTSDRNEDFINNDNGGWNGNPFLGVYQLTHDKKGRLRAIDRFSRTINGPFHSGPIAFADSGKTAAFTRVQEVRGLSGPPGNKPQLFFSRLVDGKWQDVTAFEHNHAAHSFAHPSISQDGTQLVFVSDMPGGHGGKDLYRCTKTETGWSQPENLGPTVNTALDEQFPVWKENKTLYFASNGHVGLGGLDVFVTHSSDAGWSDPENLRAPINSNRDDFGLCFFTDTSGYFTTNRKGTLGMDDIFQFSHRPGTGEELISLNGVFLYSELNPAVGSRIQLLDENNVALAYAFTNNEGEFAFDQVPAGMQYFFKYDESDPKVQEGTRIYLVDSKEDVLANIDLDNFESYVYTTLGSGTTDQMTLLDANDPGLNLDVDMPVMPTASTTNIYGNIYKHLPRERAAPITVCLMNSAGEVRVVTSEADGSFAFTDLVPDESYLVKLDERDAAAFKLMFTTENGGFMANAARLSAQEFALPKPVLMQPLDANNMLLGRLFERQPGDVDAGTEVYMVNDEGAVIGVSKIDAYGSFRFNELSPDQASMLRIATDDQTRMKLLVLNKAGALKARPLPSPDGFALNTDALEPPTAQNAVVQGMLYSETAAPVRPGRTVVLMNEEGTVIATTTADVNGRFRFEQLPVDQPYLVKLAARDDAELKMVLLDASGSLATTHKASESLRAIATVPAADQPLAINNISGQVFETLPGDAPGGLPVYVLDNAGAILYETVADAYGRFAFNALPNELQYLVKVGTTDAAMQIALLDNEGSIAQLAQSTDEGFVAPARLAPKPAPVVALKGAVFDQSPGDLPAGTPVHVVNAEGEVIMTAYTDEYGDFEFERLPPDEHYLLTLDVQDDSDLRMVFKNNEGAITEVVQPTSKGFKVAETAAIEHESVAAIHGKLYQYLPGDVPPGLKVMLLDDAGEPVYITFTDEKGNFAFNNLPPNADYRIQVQNQPEELKMVFVDDRGKLAGRAKRSGDDYLATTAPAADVEVPTVGMAGQLSAATEGENLAGRTVQVLDKQGRLLYSTKTDAFGGFKFERLPPDLDVTLQVENATDDVSMAFMKPDGELTKPVKIRNNGALVLNDIDFADEETNEPELEFTGEIVSELSSEELEGKRVDVVDSKGKIISSAYVDANGQFKFEKLPPDTDFTFRLQDAPEDAQMALLKPDGTKTKPKKIREIDNDLVLEEIGFAEEETDEPELEFTGEIVSDMSSEELEGKRVDVVDSKGKIISSAYVDANGQFKFEKLPPDTDFTFRLQDAPEDAQMALLKPDGTKTKPKKIREIDNDLVLEEIGFAEEETNEPELEFTGEIVSDLSSEELEGKRVDVVDSKGEIISSAYVDANGQFKFEKLPPDTDFTFRLQDAPEDAQMALLKPDGTKTKPKKIREIDNDLVLEEIGFAEEETDEPELEFTGEIVSDLSSEELEGKRVDVVDSKGEIISSAYVDANGQFKFEKLPPDTDFT